MRRYFSYPLGFYLPVFLLGIVGLVMVYSSSHPLTLRFSLPSWYFLLRHAIFLFAGAFLFLVLLGVPSERIRGVVAWVWLFLLLVLFFMLLFPEITYASRGARRWISFFGFTFQPGEIAKPVLAIYLARILSSREGKPSIALIGLSVLVTVIFALLLLRQPDFGGAVIMFLILLTTLFLSGVPVWSFLFLGIPAFFLAQDLILSTPYRRGRWLAFLDPWNPEYTATYSYQLIQSLIAFGNGGLFGEGLMLGKQKLFYLPEAHTDFVFSIIGEELGLLGTFFVLFLYLWLFLAWFSIAEKTTSLFSRLVVMGGMVLFFGQVLIHMGVTIGLLPTKGLTLPLISYGGSSLLSTFFTLGVVGRIAKEGREGNEMGEKGFQFYFWNLRERR